MVKDSMFNEEARRKEHGISSHTEALVTEKRGRSKSRKPRGDDLRQRRRKMTKKKKKKKQADFQPFGVREKN
jgi:hypothetical protein